MGNRAVPIAYAILAALCYGISIPVSKLLLNDVPPVFMAALIYTGAGLGMLLIRIFRKSNISKEAKITKKELPYAFGMLVLDILAPIFLMIGLSKSSSATASLLNNFEIVATSTVALIVFREAIGKRTWIAIALITAASIILSVDDFSTLKFSVGAIFVLLACVCWGFENNCTSKLSHKNPLETVIIKGIGSGLASLIIAFVAGQYITDIAYISVALLLGFVAYGLSVYLYIYAQRHLGAARTSVYYAFAPFIGVGLSFIIFREIPTTSYLTAFGIMVLGAYLTAFEKHQHSHIHNLTEHEHRHNHNDGHHNHVHTINVIGEHSHLHIHDIINHHHVHTPDLHHSHEH